MATDEMYNIQKISKFPLPSLRKLNSAVEWFAQHWCTTDVHVQVTCVKFQNSIDFVTSLHEQATHYIGRYTIANVHFTPGMGFQRSIQHLPR